MGREPGGLRAGALVNEALNDGIRPKSCLFIAKGYELCFGSRFPRDRVVKTYFFRGIDLSRLLLHHSPWVERTRHRIVIFRAIICVRNQVLHIKHISSTNVAGKLKPIGVWIDILYDLHMTNISGSELVVVTSRKKILSKDSSDKIANFKLHLPSPSVSSGLVFPGSLLQIILHYLMNLLLPVNEVSRLFMDPGLIRH
ncbi:hypothetical protein CRG98_008337 [Punica granatum]|uniref:Uncharacterized protein n=1 Tax=Punica granatum TaxID=22663 RepID=A0A2I0KS77_PUNGR|nr:hypothetical protein CRG98_008337 [Punica granatum]